MNYVNLLREYFLQMESRTRIRLGIGCACLLLIAIILTAVNTRITFLKKKRAVRETDVAEMLVLKQRYLEANAGSQKLSNRMASAKPDDSPAKIIEDIGIKGKSSQIRQVKGEERGGYIEDAAEVKLEGLTANEAVNLVYKLEKGDKPVIIKKALFKARFDDPAKLDLVLTLALLKQAPQGQK